MTNFILNVDNEIQNGGEKHPFAVNVLHTVHKFLPCSPDFGDEIATIAHAIRSVALGSSAIIDQTDDLTDAIAKES